MPTTAPFRTRSYDFRLYAGENALANLTGEADRVGAKRAFVVCGRSVARGTDLIDRVQDALKERYAGVFDGVKASSPLPSVEAGVMAARAAGADLIVALGGGSAVVTARAIIILLAEEGTAHDLSTKYPPGQTPVSPRLMAPKVPNVLVLTTPTTAMNRAGTAVMDMETHHRLELFDPKTRPSAIIWDNDALLTAPASLYLSASASAFSGVATGVATSNPNPIAHGDRLQALRLMLDNIPKLDTDQDGGDVRLQLAAAAFLSNRASDVESSGGGGGFGIISALAHTVDTLYEDCSHGAAYSITTPPGLRFNIAQTVAGQARLAAALGADADDGGEESLAHAAAERVESFYRSVGMPLRLRDVGVPQSDLTRIAEDAQKDFYLHRNPRPVQGGADLIRLLEGMW